jgi:heptose-I-phosphate ethanolaminephosphotransferase
MNTLSRRTVLIFIVVAALLLIVIKIYHRELIQKINLNILISEGLDERVIPHRINYLDKLSHILDDGIRSLEIDLIFRDSEHHGYFEVGHDEFDATGAKFDLFLNVLQDYEIKKIWLDIKNSSDENINAIIAELERIDSIYNIKKIAIVESSNTGNGLQKLSLKGFHTSYYLPTSKILDLLRENNDSDLKKEANRIKQQIINQSLSALSFDLRLYFYVKNYIEPVIPETVVYHAWDSVRLYDVSSISTLKNSTYFKDPRLKTIIVKYYWP